MGSRAAGYRPGLVRHAEVRRSPARPCEAIAKRETRNLLGPPRVAGRGFGSRGGAWAGARAQARAERRPRAGKCASEPEGGASGPGAGPGARVRRRVPGGCRVPGVRRAGMRGSARGGYGAGPWARGRGLGARAQARAGRLPRAGGAGAGGCGRGARRVARGRGRGSKLGSGLKRARPGAAGREGQSEIPARSLAPAPALWKRTTATVSTACGPPGGRPLPHSLPSPARRRLGRLAFPGEGSEGWESGGRTGRGAAGGREAQGRPGLRGGGRRSRGRSRRGRSVWVAGRCHPAQAWRCLRER